MKQLIVLLLLNLLVWLYFFHYKPAILPHIPTPLSGVTGPLSGPTPTPQIITLLTTGDVMLGRSINIESQKRQDYTWPFNQIAPVLRSADITFINLENPIISNCPQIPHGFKFCSPPKSIQGLTFAGIDIANLANNHTTNFGQSGLDETIALLTTHSISVTGTTDPVYKKIADTQFAFLGFNDTFTPLPLDTVTQAIAAAQADITVVAFHWGTEYTAAPNSRQITLAHAAVDAGADIIVGNHPHWPQTIETYHGKYIYYSHGNFIFDQFWSNQTQEGIIIKTFIKNQQLAGYEVLPIRVIPPGFAALDRLPGP